MSIARRMQTLLALLAAVMGGFAIGIATAIGLVDMGALVAVPEWVPRAERLGWVAIIGTSMAAGGWVYLDYRYVRDKA